MELGDKYNLRQKILKRTENDFPLETMNNKKIFGDILDGVNCLHNELGVAHCDIKANNIVFVNGIGKMIDFGTSKFVNEVNFSVCCTFSYLAPELYENNRRLPTGFDLKPCDMWSLVVLLFFMIFGYLPFQHKNLFQKQWMLSILLNLFLFLIIIILQFVIQ